MRMALIHALKHSIVPIEAAFARLWPEARPGRPAGQLALGRPGRDGALTPAMTEHLTLARYAGRGADGILSTCSAFGPCIEACARALPIPVLKPNEAMIEEALALAGPDRAHRPAGDVRRHLASMPPEFAAVAPRPRWCPAWRTARYRR